MLAYNFNMFAIVTVIYLCFISACTSYIWETESFYEDPYKQYQLIPPISNTSQKFASYFMGLRISRLSSGRIRRGPNQGKASNIVFVLDSSSSVGRRHFQQEVKAIHTMVAKSRDDNRYGIVVFSTDAFIQMNFADKRTTLKKLKKVPFIPGRTNIQKGLLLAKTLFEDPESNKTKGALNKVLLITDGLSNVQKELTLYRAFELKMMGVQIYVVAVGRFVYGIPESIGLATTSLRHLFRVRNMKAFLNVARMIPSVPFRSALH
ncbi:collagen alpha-4(VI) chain-like isoform X2 [Actinia tenebrosa]|uniref:Collagen alpha-4(VI) chain-like isoform X2 n=1 Tax=Actinia tenebrosa TaxID=6105 RepID=A0A6P8I6Z4_ACTTE|nr:collagen alpha-4(VI) chain-like isoform X2 [Actinia tenebrosa]